MCQNCVSLCVCTERTDEREEIRKKNERASFIWREKFCLGDREIAQHKVINYETIAKMWKRPWLRAFISIFCVCKCVCVCLCVWVKVAICYNTHPHWRWPFSFAWYPIENKLKQFFIFFRFIFLIISFIFPHFARLHTHTHSSQVCHSYTFVCYPMSVVHRASWTMLNWYIHFFIIYPRKMRHTVPMCMCVSVLFCSPAYSIEY